MRFRKIKAAKDSRIYLIYEKKNNKNGWDEYSLNCIDKARPEFYVALQALAEDVVEICELDSGSVSNITVSSVTISHGGDLEVPGAVIVASKKLEYSNAPLNLITPHKAFSSYSGDDEKCDPKQLLPDFTVVHLKILFEEAMLYVNGTREQIDMFAGSADESKDWESVDTSPDASKEATREMALA